MLNSQSPDTPTQAQDPQRNRYDPAIAGPLALRLTRRDLSPGDLASLRRMNTDRPDSDVFWHLIISYRITDPDSSQHDDVQTEQAWAAIIAAIAHGTSYGQNATTGPHDPTMPLGRAPSSRRLPARPAARSAQRQPRPHPAPDRLGRRPPPLQGAELQLRRPGPAHAHTAPIQGPAGRRPHLHRTPLQPGDVPPEHVTQPMTQSKAAPIQTTGDRNRCYPNSCSSTTSQTTPPSS